MTGAVVTAVGHGLVDGGNDRETLSRRRTRSAVLLGTCLGLRPAHRSRRADLAGCLDDRGKEQLQAEGRHSRGRGRERVERGAGRGLEGVLASRAERRLARGGRRRRDAILDVAVARADLPRLVAGAAACAELVGRAEELGRGLGLDPSGRR